MAKRIITLTESDIKRMVRQTIKEAYDQFSDDDFASDGDPYGLTTNKEPVGDFKVEDIIVNGDIDVSKEFFSIYGQNFDSKYDFADLLNHFMQENFGTTVTDVDLASDFGDEGNEICINTDNRMPITAHGGYTDMYESRIRRIVGESVRRLIREHDPDDPDYGQYGDMYDAYDAIKQYEKESSIETYYIPSKNQLVLDEPDEEGEWNDYYYTVVITPKFNPIDEDGFEMEDVDYSFDTGNDKELEKQLEEQYGAEVNKLIDDNFDAIREKIKQYSDYYIY